VCAVTVDSLFGGLIRGYISTKLTRHQWNGDTVLLMIDEALTFIAYLLTII
jgi:hypothetical protein